MVRHLVFHAIDFAARAHKGQYRKGTRIPYVVHPINVGKILIENGCSDTVVIAGILHDVIEDTDVAIDLIREQFGEDVADLVMWGSEKDKSDTWENRKRQTLISLESAPMDVLLISLIDKLDNIRSMRAGSEKEGEEFWARFNRPKVTQAWYYRGLLDVFLRRIDVDPGKTLLSLFCSEVDKVFGNIGLNPDLA
jgi:(p)ppGpp synthase/HD superfamily hydrolase